MASEAFPYRIRRERGSPMDMSLGHIPLRPADAQVLSGLSLATRLLWVSLVVGTALGIIGAAVVIGFVSDLPFAPQGAEMGMIVGIFACVGVLMIGIFGVQAWLLHRASKHLQLVVTTDGADQAHLMKSLGAMQGLFILEVVLALFTLASSTVSLINVLSMPGGVAL